MANPNLLDLNKRGQESVRALIQAIAPDIANNSNGNLSSEEVASRLTDKLVELVGPEGAEKFDQHHNERGELVNEEGLPIIEITEPATTPRVHSSSSRPTPVTVEPLIPVHALPLSTQEKLRQKRDRILDFLENEERQEETAERQREAAELEELSQKRREAAEKDKDRLKEARDLQKKMGRALLQNIGKAKEKERQEQEEQRIRDEEAAKQRSPSIKKKTVAFVESAEHIDQEPEPESATSVEWGDITPARLRPTKRPTLMSQALLDRHPMKLSVVERVPGGQPTTANPPPLAQKPPDSDDDSEPDSVPSSDTEAEEEPILEADEVDLDFAQHQREIALEYLAKRNTIGQDAAAAMMNHSHDLDHQVAPSSESDVVTGTQKPALSQFKASRLASAFGASAPSTSSQSTSLGASVLPAASTRTLQRAVRTGKLDPDGKLMGPEADSESEGEDPALQEVLNLLRKGEVYNLGPNGEYLHVIPPQDQNGETSPSSTAQQATPSSSTLPPPSMRSKTSKFKASRAAAGRPAGSTSITIPDPSLLADRSPSMTPVSHAHRSSPKLGSPTTMAPTISERDPPASTSTSHIHSPNPGKLLEQNHPQFSMIVDSPSFPMYQGSQHSAPIPSMVIDSPSYPPGQPSRRLERPPTVMSTAVRETGHSSSQQSQQHAETEEEGRPTRISKFKAERMGPS